MKLSKKQIKYFKDCVYEWQGVLGLNDWRILVESDELEEGAGAVVRYMADQHIAVITCQTIFPDAEFCTDAELNRNALHECLHVRLAQLCELVTPQMRERVGNIEHAIIRNLENVLLGRD